MHFQIETSRRTPPVDILEMQSCATCWLQKLIAKVPRRADLCLQGLSTTGHKHRSRCDLATKPIWEFAVKAAAPGMVEQNRFDLRWSLLEGLLFLIALSLAC